MSRGLILIPCLALTVAGCSSGADGGQETSGEARPSQFQGMSTSRPAASGDGYVLDVDLTTQTVAVTMAETGDRLYRVETGSGGPAAHVRVSGSTVHLTAAGPTTIVEIEISADMPWSLQTGDGIGLLQVDATHGTLTGLTARANLAGIDISAGMPVGTPVISIRNGLSDLRMHLPDDTGVRVHAGGGAGAVVLYGERTPGVAAGDTVATPDFRDTGYIVDLAGGGVHSVVVD